MTTTAIPFEAQREQLRVELKRVRAEHEDAAIAAAQDSDQKPRAGKLRKEVKRIEEEIQELDTAEQAHDRRWHTAEAEAAAARDAEGRKTAMALTAETFEQLVSVNEQMEEAINSLQALIAQGRQLEATWRAAVRPFVSQDDRQTRRMWETVIAEPEMRDIEHVLKPLQWSLAVRGSSSLAYGDRARARQRTGLVHVRESLGVSLEEADNE